MAQYAPPVQLRTVFNEADFNKTRVPATINGTGIGAITVKNHTLANSGQSVVLWQAFSPTHALPSGVYNISFEVVTGGSTNDTRTYGSALVTLWGPSTAADNFSIASAHGYVMGSAVVPPFRDVIWLSLDPTMKVIDITNFFESGTPVTVSVTMTRLI